MVQAKTHPYLFITEARLKQLRHWAARQEPNLMTMLGQARFQLKRDIHTVLTDQRDVHGVKVALELESFAAGCALLALMEENVEAAQAGWQVLKFVSEDYISSDLRRASVAMMSAQIWAGAHPLWDDASRVWAADWLARLAQSFRVLDGRGNPHTVGNNWWAVTHSGALLAAIAAHGEVGADGQRYDLSEEIAWARGRLLAFCGHFGDAGLYHEGFGYQFYTLTYLLPALYALRLLDGTDVRAWFPGLQQMPGSLLATVATRWAHSDREDEQDQDCQDWGAMLSWNDAGLNWPSCGAEAFFFDLAPRAQLGAVREMIDRLEGLKSPLPRFASRFGGLFFMALLYPFEVPAEDPEGCLPHAVLDSRQGLAVFRNHYRDQEDVILGVYARTTHVGGHSQQDAGSVRLMGLGEDWIIGGGQARPAATYQSVVTVDDPKPETKYQQQGLILWYEPRAGGGCVGLDLRKVHASYSERYVALETEDTPGVVACFALLDLIDDHRMDRTWHWNLTFEPSLRFEIHSDQSGFTLRGQNQTFFLARFLHARPERFQCLEMPASQRTFSSAGQVCYRSRPYLRATFARQKHLAIYLAALIGRGSEPAWPQAAEGVGWRVGEWIWKRPFGAAVAPEFRPGASGGMCRYPSGTLR